MDPEKEILLQRVAELEASVRGRAEAASEEVAAERQRSKEAAREQKRAAEKERLAAKMAALEDAPAEPASPPLSPKARLKRNVVNAGRNGVSLIRTGLRYPLEKVGNIREWGREKLKNRRNNKRYEPQPEEPQGGLQRAPAEPPAEPQGTAPPKESA